MGPSMHTRLSLEQPSITASHSRPPCTSQSSVSPGSQQDLVCDLQKGSRERARRSRLQVSGRAGSPQQKASDLKCGVLCVTAEPSEAPLCICHQGACFPSLQGDFLCIFSVRNKEIKLTVKLILLPLLLHLLLGQEAALKLRRVVAQQDTGNWTSQRGGSGRSRGG